MKVGGFELFEEKSGDAELERLRGSIHMGDIVYYPQEIPNMKSGMVKKIFKKSRVTGIYPHLISVRPVNGGRALPVWTITYAEMIIDGRILRREG